MASRFDVGQLVCPGSADGRLESRSTPRRSHAYPSFRSTDDRAGATCSLVLATSSSAPSVQLDLVSELGNAGVDSVGIVDFATEHVRRDGLPVRHEDLPWKRL